MEYPDWLDPRKAAEGRRRFTGSMPLERMQRLLPLLASGVGEVRFSADFEYDQQARVTIQIKVEAELSLLCQLSLEPYTESIQRSSTLGVIGDIAEEALLPENYEPVLAQHGRLALLDLVEDELLLGLPQVPRNPQLDAAQFQVSSSDYRSIEDQSFKDQGFKDQGFKDQNYKDQAVAANREPVRQPFAGLAEQLAQKRAGQLSKQHDRRTQERKK
jgi:uncharacterized protein